MFLIVLILIVHTAFYIYILCTRLPDIKHRYIQRLSKCLMLNAATQC